MAIYSNKGEVKIEGMCANILSELSMIIYALKEDGIPDRLINSSIEAGYTEYKKRKLEKAEKNGYLNEILKKLGLEEH